MVPRRLNMIHWRINTKLAGILGLIVFLPILIVLFLAVYQNRNALLLEQNETRLETLGAFEIAQTDQTLQSLANTIQNLITASDLRTLLRRFLFREPVAGFEEDTVQAMPEIETKLGNLMSAMPSLSRARLLKPDGDLLLHGTRRKNVFMFRYSTTASDPTPADALLQSGDIEQQTILTEIYPNPDNTPAIDAVLTFWLDPDNPTQETLLGYLVLTFNLKEAGQDPNIPDLLANVRDFPTSDQRVVAFLVNNQGRVVAASSDLPSQPDASDSEGFLAAQGGETGITRYTSPLLNKNVIGYHETVHFATGTEMTFLVETELDTINQKAIEGTLPPLLIVATSALFLGAIALLASNVAIVHPLVRLTNAVHRIAEGQWDTRIPPVTRRDEIGILNTASAQMFEQLIGAVSELEGRVGERNHTLQTILEAGRIITSIRDLDTLLEEVVNLIRDQFATVYHAQVFLIDSRTNQARLRASTGAAGRILLERGHYLEVGSQSVIGSVTASGHAVVALDTSNNPIHKRNEFLPETRAEMALPLRLGNRLIGALDLQSTQPDAFSEQDVELFQGMADQITIAIENAQLFTESNARLQEIERLNRSLTEIAWRETQRQHEILSAAAGLAGPLQEDWTELQWQAMQTREIAERIEGERVTFAVPVIRRDQVLGAVEWQVPATRYSNATRQTAVELTTRLALTADNIRLFEQSRRIAQRELLVNEISSKLTGSTDIDQILQTAIRELGLALNLPVTAIRLISPSADNE
jgi:GAF domain-containing protein/HAMP domain-containing protein